MTLAREAGSAIASDTNARQAGINQLRRMVDHNQQKLTAREMVRAHAYPVLAAVSSLSLLSITVLLIPQAVKSHRYNRCIDAQIAMRASINPKGETAPGKMNYLKAVEHCEGF
jgi:hypothetical protein